MQPILAHPGEVVVSETAPGGDAPLVRHGSMSGTEAGGTSHAGHSPWDTDAPQVVGEDRMAALLGARVARAVRLVASQQHLPLTRVAVRLRAEDEPAETGGPLELEVLLEGPLDAKQRTYLMAIARAAAIRRRP